MTTPEPEQIAASLTKAQRAALIQPRWLHPGGMAPVCLVKFTDPWPEGVAQFFTMREDRLTPLGLTVMHEVQKRAEVIDCPICFGDCSSANPPVINCPVRNIVKDQPND